MDLEKLRFPIGKYTPIKEPNKELLNQWIKEIEEFPKTIDKLTKNLSTQELNWKYRPDGWTLKQVVHHCADSHMNSVIRFKLTLTETTPIIRPYLEDKWAELTDSTEYDIGDSILLLKALHKKWVFLLRSFTNKQLNFEFIHPDYDLKFNLAENIGLYAWHCNHHLGHVKNAIASKGIYN